MSLISGLRVRKDMEAHGHEQDEEAAYLLTPAAEQYGHSQEKQSGRRRTFSLLPCSKRFLMIVFSIACFVSVISLFISSSVSAFRSGACSALAD